MTHLVDIVVVDDVVKVSVQVVQEFDYLCGKHRLRNLVLQTAY